MKDYFSLTSRKGRVNYLYKRGNILRQIKDRIKWNIYPKLYITPKYPTTLDIEAASICQLQCPMCGQHLMCQEDKGIMDFDLYKKIIDEAAPYVYSIKLSWRGEPLLNPKIFDMVRYAKEKGIKDVAFLTNGVALTDDKIDEMIDSGLDWVSFSIDGLNETYEKIRYPAKFEEITRKLLLIKLIKTRRELSKPLVRIQSIYSAIKDDPDKYYQFFRNLADRINFIADEARAEPNKKFPVDPNYICPFPWQRMFIAFDGTVLACPCDYKARYKLGNVKEKTLHEIWKGYSMEFLRDMQRKRMRQNVISCANCCHGGLMKDTVISVNGKNIKIKEYVEQGEKNG